MKRIVVGGIGNVLLGDDGVGPYVISLLEERYRFPDYVELVDFGTPGLDLLEHVAGAEAVILLDAAENGKPPGTLTKYAKPDVLRLAPAPRLDPHSPALGATLAAAELLGTAPATFILIGITPMAFAAGLSLSRSVVEAAQRAARCVIDELQQLDVPVLKRGALERSRASATVDGLQRQRNCRCGGSAEGQLFLMTNGGSNPSIQMLLHESWK